MFQINAGKNAIVGCGDQRYYCLPIKTRVMTDQDSLEDIARYTAPLIRDGDVLFVSEKMLACVQGRAIAINDIAPGALAKLLSRFVKKNPAGIGLKMPETMQCAIWECGRLRILLAAVAGAVGKVLRKKGWFYKVAGSKAAAIDGPCRWTIQPYNQCVVLSPEHPNQAARELSAMLRDIPVLIVDINDLGRRVLGCSTRDLDCDGYLSLLSQNPLGQGRQSTPLGILRPIGHVVCAEKYLWMAR